MTDKEIRDQRVCSEEVLSRGAGAVLWVERKSDEVGKVA
jgi:hypothetical protein